MLNTTLATPRWRHTTTTLLDGSVLLAGGLINAGTLTPDAEHFVNPR
ncbi:MAG TPA: hypothetical protein VGF73_11355 [Chthoniobacterales bacterium]